MILDILSRWLGYRRLGAEDAPDKRDYKTSVILKEQILSPEKNIELANTHIKNQGRTNYCSSYALASVVETMLTAMLKKKIWIDPFPFVENQKKRRAKLAERDPLEGWDIDKDGDTLQNALQALLDYGCYVNDYNADGEPNYRKATIDGYAKVTRSEIPEWIKKGHPIYTGSGVYDNYTTDGFWNVRGRNKRGGHAFFIPNLKTYYQMQNSWGGNWNNHGLANIKKEDTRRLFSKYVIYGLRIA